MNWILVLPAILVGTLLFNLFTMRRLLRSENQEITSSIAVLVPMRNEERNVAGSIHSLIQQKNLSLYEIHALDDQSIDRTREELGEISSAQFSWHSGENLPNGWLGKNFACWQLAEKSDADYLVFVDADVRLEPDAIERTILSMKVWGWQFISVYPRQIAISWSEKLIQPLLQWSWLVSVPLRIAEKFQIKSMVVANGQFMVVSRTAYFAVGGHQSIRSQVLDDLALARNLREAKFHGGVVNGATVSHCRMYQSWAELFEGYSKSQWSAFGNIPGALMASFLLLITSLAPLLLAIGGKKEGTFALILILATRIITALQTRGSVLSSIFHPLAITIWIYLIWLSWIRKVRGSLRWKGRTL